jgi:hypothetical protein
MTNLLDRIRKIREDLAVARRESDMVDELLAQTFEESTPESLRDLAARLRALADAKDGDWITKTFTPSTADELRCLAEAYEEMADEPLFWSDER